MKLVDFLHRDEMTLAMRAPDKDAALRELVALFDLDGDAEEILYKLLLRRESLGSTGIGKGVAIPHCRSLVVERLRVAYGRKPEGLPFDALDAKPVHHLFLIVAPPIEVSNQYLPVLGKIAQLCKEPKNLQRLAEASSAADVLTIMEEAEP